MIDNERLYRLIGERVRRIREAQTPRMSQEDLARILDLKRTSITNIERGNQKLTLDTLLRLCEHFALEIDAIVPKVREIAVVQSRSVVVGGKTQEVGAKTASLLNSLRPSRRERR